MISLALVTALVPPTLDSLFGWVLRVSWQASLVAAVVLLVQALLGGRISARWRYNLWLLVVARLLLPAVPESRWSPFNLLPRDRADVADARGEGVAGASGAGRVALMGDADRRVSPPARAQVPPLPFKSAAPAETDIVVHVRHGDLVAAPPERSADATTRSDTPDPAPAIAALATRPGVPRPVEATESVPWQLVLLLCWLAGVGFCLVRLLWATIALRHVLRRAQPVGDLAALDLVCRCAAELHVSRLPALLAGPDGFGPALVGCLRPQLVLPASVLSGFDADELRMVVLHELAHLRRRDVALNWLLAVIGAVHWFNPFVWVALRRMRADRELACDEMALRAAGGRAARAAYGPALLKLLESFTAQPRPFALSAAVPAAASASPAATGVLDSKAYLCRRIAMIARFDSRKPMRRPVLATVLSVLAGGVALTGAVRGQTEPTGGGAPAAENRPPTPAATAPSAAAAPAAPGGEGSPQEGRGGGGRAAAPQQPQPDTGGGPAAGGGEQRIPILSELPVVGDLFVSGAAPGDGASGGAAVPAPGGAPAAEGAAPGWHVSVPHQLVPGDQVQIVISDLIEPGVDTVKQTRVSEEGTITLPTIKEPLNVAGLTEADLQMQIVKAYADSKRLENPRVLVAITEAAGMAPMAGAGGMAAPGAPGGMSMPGAGLVGAGGGGDMPPGGLPEAQPGMPGRMGGGGAMAPGGMPGMGMGAGGRTSAMGGAAGGPAAGMAGYGGMMMGGMPPAMPAAGAMGRVEDPADREADARAIANLKRPAPVELQSVPLGDALTQFADTAGVDLVVDWNALAGAGIDVNVPVTLRLRESIPAAQTLEWMLRTAAGGNLGYAIDRGIVLVSSREQLNRMVVTRAYDVSDLAVEPNQWGGQAQDVDSVVRTVAPDAWAESGGSGSLLRFRDKLIVTATEPVHREVEKLLALLRLDPRRADADQMTVEQIAEVDPEMAASLRMRDVISARMEEKKARGAAPDQPEFLQLNQQLETRESLIKARAEFFREKHKGRDVQTGGH